MKDGRIEWSDLTTGDKVLIVAVVMVIIGAILSTLDVVL